MAGDSARQLGHAVEVMLMAAVVVVVVVVVVVARLGRAREQRGRPGQRTGAATARRRRIGRGGRVGLPHGERAVPPRRRERVEGRSEVMKFGGGRR